MCEVLRVSDQAFQEHPEGGSTLHFFRVFRGGFLSHCKDHTGIFRFFDTDGQIAELAEFSHSLGVHSVGHAHSRQGLRYGCSVQGACFVLVLSEGWQGSTKTRAATATRRRAKARTKARVSTKTIAKKEHLFLLRTSPPSLGRDISTNTKNINKNQQQQQRQPSKKASSSLEAETCEHRLSQPKCLHPYLQRFRSFQHNLGSHIVQRSFHRTRHKQRRTRSNIASTSLISTGLWFGCMTSESSAHCIQHP